MNIAGVLLLRSEYNLAEIQKTVRLILAVFCFIRLRRVVLGCGISATFFDEPRRSKMAYRIRLSKSPLRIATLNSAPRRIVYSIHTNPNDSL